MGKKAVLAYSGGLDTSVILKWMVNKGYDVIAFTANIGQEEGDFVGIRDKALKCGAKDSVIVDVREEFIRDFIFPAIRGNAKYQGRYLLGTSLARPLTAKAQVEIAKKYGAAILSHGSTGKGNDQVRFELAYLTLFPEAEIYAPWKDPEFLGHFQGREDLIMYAAQNGIPVKQSTKDPWSEDDNILHISHEAGILENPLLRPPERMYKMMVLPKNAPDKENCLRIHFENGTPIKIDRIGLEVISDREQKISVLESVEGPLEMFLYLNKIAGENGIGLVDMVEDRFVGMKSRGVYETPAGTVLMAAHEDLEGLTMDREVRQIRDRIMPDFATTIYRGFWFSPEGQYLRKIMNEAQHGITGSVNVVLYKGNVVIIGRESPLSLYDTKIASMSEAGGYDPTKARGFIDLNALRLRTWARVQQLAEREIV